MLRKKMLEMSKDLKGMKLFVINDILDCRDKDEEIKGYIQDVINYGCKSGIVTSLIYLNETRNFFKEYFEEILDIYQDIREELLLTGVEVNYNDLSWLAYEETVRRIASELEIY